MIEGWELVGTAPGAWAGPDVVDGGATWQPAVVPGTVASSLGVDLDHPRDLDGRDWWYRATVTAPADGGVLRFDGLATLCEVWVDGVSVARSRNMFRPLRVPVGGGRHTLLLVFRSVATELARRRPRPRWKTNLVDHQNLRWIRTCLLGRIPGWTPAVPAIGPWRAVAWEPGTVRRIDLHTGAPGGVARLRVEVELGVVGGSVRLHLGDRVLPLAPDPGGATFAGDFALPGVPLWFPHTHGAPHTEPARLEVVTSGGTSEVDLGRLGFREVEVDTEGGRVQFRVNGREVFCRGACWTVDDIRSLDGTAASTRASVRLAREAGANMLRVGGTMTWASEALLAACDAEGVLLWQDLPLANMDHPFGDAEFGAEIAAELTVQAGRLARHACVAAYCGGSEIAQQAAMMGLPPEDGTFFTETAPHLLAAAHPGVPWFPATPVGGALPFHTGAGLAHYYGVGAYLRPLTDVRRAGVRFTPECLGFSNVPEPETCDMVGAGVTPPPHHPAWKRAVPRDASAGWDFEDVRDHYLAALFGVEAVALRSHDPERYRALSRVVTGEVMARTFAEWRRPGSGCGGALVWFWKDLRPGAGWGLVDATGRPKAAWWYLRRAWAARALSLTDEGLDGLGIHLTNEHPEAFAGGVEITLFKAGRRVVAHARTPVEIPAFGAATLSADALLGRFTDLTWSYRFGPPGHDAVLVCLVDAAGGVCAQDAWFPLARPLETVDAGELTASAEPVEGGVRLTLTSSRFLQAVAVSAPGYTPSDNYFHLPPGTRVLDLAAEVPARPLRAWITAMNLDGGVAVRLG